jgi:hypothetical protein
VTASERQDAALAERLERLRQQIAAALMEIKDRHFLPHVMVSFVARNPEVEDGDVVVTEDTLDAVAFAVRQKIERGQNGWSEVAPSLACGVDEGEEATDGAS